MWPFVAKAIDYFDTVPPLLLLIMAVSTMRRPGRDYIVCYLCCQFFFNGYANLLNELERDNLFAYSLNFSWSYFILSLYFARLYASPVLKRLIMGLVSLYQLNLMYTLQVSSTVGTFTSVPFGAVSSLITLGCLSYYGQQLSGQPRENILKVRDFWYVNGIFTYYASNFFIFLTYNTLVSRNLVNIGIVWKIHNAVFLVMCVYFFIGMRCKTLPER
ncbi:hypothetical protein [Spirosoma pollinicola]|uniref:Uncharacterized protein n=1 Tax=Spirosoma pollinicola TaxID=2057025 RepID=A0A2K8Z3R3_9BACT|nr:hypothetical protein [Spirosoma pollinicola]AUD04513.1 hypothetical protein CWM47_23305 [Spirosoma pollinicola]